MKRSMSRPRRIVITGVSRGLGRSLALRLSQMGHFVSGCAPTRESPSTAIEYSQVDISDPRSVRAWSRRVLQHAPVDIVINNAGIILPQFPFWELSARRFDSVIDINIKGTSNVLRSFLPGMIAARRGIIITMLSGGAQRCIAGSSAYNASKWALEGLSRTIAAELPRGVGLIGVRPGATNTFMLRKVIGDAALVYGSAEEWATRAAPFVLSLSPRENGQVLSVPVR